jgi:23S rRNA pseudouridine1911/1915/1917 synthase
MKGKSPLTKPVTQHPTPDNGVVAVPPTCSEGGTLSTLMVEPHQGPIRLDLFLAHRLAPAYSRAQLARMIRAGHVRINGSTGRPSASVKAGDCIELETPPVKFQPSRGLPFKAPPSLEVLHADDDLIVVNKPAGMVVHSAPGHPDSTLVDAVVGLFPDVAAIPDLDGVTRPGIVHRLDKDTTGVIVIARNARARAALSSQFKARRVRKIYLALVRGVIDASNLVVDRPLGRHPIERKRMSVNARNGREAVTFVDILMRFAPDAENSLGATLVRARPVTGRTHQIRVHLASIGHPCIGDPVYGGRQKHSFGRQALHALAIGLTHPKTGAALQFVASPPSDFVALLAAYGVYINTALMAQWIEGVLGEGDNAWLEPQERRTSIH